MPVTNGLHGNRNVEELRQYIGEQYGVVNLPEAAREYKTKSRNAQEAHEAVRPTSAMRSAASRSRRTRRVTLEATSTAITAAAHSVMRAATPRARSTG